MFMKDKHFIFIGGLHKSGTSLLHQILRSHPAISGFVNTGVPEDEGQHLQSVYPPAKAFGGPGQFGFDTASFMDEKHSLATPNSATRLLAEWGRYWDDTKNYFLEKSPPNLVRTRFLQCIFPTSSFVIIIRHPIAVAYATKKWSKTNISSLIAHGLLCHERFLEDMPHLNRVYVLRYEDFVLHPYQHISALLEWIGLEPFGFHNEVRPNANDKYFEMWESDRPNVLMELLPDSTTLYSFDEYEKRANSLGYSIDEPKKLLPIGWAGPHNKTLQRTP
jgi:hypothetical protein